MLTARINCCLFFVLTHLGHCVACWARAVRDVALQYNLTGLQRMSCRQLIHQLVAPGNSAICRISILFCIWSFPTEQAAVRIRITEQHHASEPIFQENVAAPGPVYGRCSKHELQQRYHTLLKEFRIVFCTSTTSAIRFQPTLAWFKEGMDLAWHGYLGSACHCHWRDELSTISIPSTYRLGASWADRNAGSDVANLDDISDTPDD